MGVPQLMLALLLVGCFSLATGLNSRFEKPGVEHNRGFLASIMGESRRLFANHFFVRSDVYFHSGYYPSIFDQAGTRKKNHLAAKAGSTAVAQCEHDHDHADHEGEAPEDHEDHDRHEHSATCQHEAQHEHSSDCEHGAGDFLGRPKDFMDAFSRNFFISKHTHLTDKGTNGAREILPWLKLSAELDPHKLETYTVGAYWLRQLKRDDQAELFLRHGLRFNPESYELLLELGGCRFARGELKSARNLWELAVRRWHEQQDLKPAEERDIFPLHQAMNQLARLEARVGNRDAAVHWLERVKPLSPVPDSIRKRIEEVRAGGTLDADETSSK